MQGRGLLPTGAALFLVGEKGHQGDVGLRLLSGTGAGQAGIDDRLRVGVEQMNAERTSHDDASVSAGAEGERGQFARGDGEEKWKRCCSGELSQSGRRVRGFW